MRDASRFYSASEPVTVTITYSSHKLEIATLNLVQLKIIRRRKSFKMIGAGYGWVPMDHPNALVWVPCNSGDPLPRGAVHVGMDKGGERLYAGRAFHEGDLLPAKINPNHENAYVCWGGEEHVKSHYEVLCHGSVAWQNCHGNHIPPNAIVIGCNVDGEKLYMGRTFHDGTLSPGKIQPSHGKLYIPYNGEEITFDEYEIMIYRPPLSYND